MPRCVVKNCVYNKSASYYRDKTDVHLFRFPKDDEMWESWRAALHLKKEDIFKYSNVCHLHFNEDSFDTEKSPFALHLKKTAIPELITINTSCRAVSECDLSRKTTDSFCSELANTTLNVSVMDCSSLPSTSTGVFKDNLELPYRPSSSTGHLENKTPPLSPIAKDILVTTSREMKLRKQLVTAQRKIKRLRASLHHYKKKAATLANVIKSLSGLESHESLDGPDPVNVHDIGTDTDPIADVPELASVGEIPCIKTEQDDPDFVDPAQFTDDPSVEIKVEVPDELYEPKYIPDIDTEESKFDPLCLNEKTDTVLPEKRPASEQPSGENYPSKKLKTMVKEEDSTIIEDEAYFLSQSWARKYRELRPGQQLLAKKAIEEILSTAKCDGLLENSVIINGVLSLPFAGTSTNS